MPNGAETTTEALAGPGGGHATWCELLPLTWVRGRLLWLHPAAGNLGGQPSWWVPAAAGRHPTSLVDEALGRALGELFDPATAVVHSTSWRFSPDHGALVLTYLALLPPRRRLPAMPAGFAAAAVDLRRPADGRPGAAAGAVTVADVLAHGLRHFALLRTTDPAIAAALAPEWHACLVDLSPLPAGQLDGARQPPAG